MHRPRRRAAVAVVAAALALGLVQAVPASAAVAASPLGAVATVSATSPDAPTGVLATPGDGRVGLSWTAPASDGGDPIASYLLDWSTDGGSTWLPTAVTTSGPGTSLDVTGLANGTSYVFRVAAVNGIGTGAWSLLSAAAVPVAAAPAFTAPAAPSALAGVSGNTSVRLTWKAPATDGGSPVTGYAVDWSADGGSTWQPSPLATGATTVTFTVTGLANATPYVFRVAALNAAGTGQWSATSATITPNPTAPASPTAAAATPMDSRAMVTWLAPASDGGSPVTCYAGDWTTDGGKTWQAAPVTANGTTPYLQVAKLANGTSYRFRVAAVNAVGRGAWSIASAAVTPATGIVVTAPTGFKVARAADNPLDLVVSWNPVAGVDHYDVTVFDGTTDNTRIIMSDKLSMRFASTNACAAFKVYVAAVDPVAVVAKTPVWGVASAAPGGIMNMSGSRNVDGTTGTVTWLPPANPGVGGVTGYQVTVTRPFDGATLLSGVQTETTVNLTDLDPARQYVTKVTAQNAYGSCVTGTNVLNNMLPTSPTSFGVVRDPAVPTQVNLSWAEPMSTGMGPLTGYEVGYGDGVITTWVPVDAATLTYALTLDPDVDHVFAVRAVNKYGKGLLTKAIKLVKVNAALTPAMDPTVTVNEVAGDVVVTTSQPVGSNATYPQLVVAINPALGLGTFTDSHQAFNGATTILFGQVPCGVYTVTVVGTGGTAGDKEFGRRIVNRCNVGELDAGKWKVVFGRATVNGNSVDHNSGSEARTMSTTMRTTQDMVFTTTAQLNSGWGYGIWTRATVTSGGSISGYSFQFDPGYANVNPGWGPALLLRLWSAGKECGNPIAKVKWPAGVETYKPHRVTVVAKGDQLYATIDNVNLFSVPSLSAAVAASGCGMPVPTGTEVGFRTWSPATAKFTGTTVN